jgi:hypothetical protein
MNQFLLVIAVALTFSGCAITPSRPQDYTISSKRRLVYTDDLVRSRGRVFVAHGGRASGNYPSDDDLKEIQTLENALRSKNYLIADTRVEAEYCFYTGSNGENGMFPSFSCDLNRYIRSHQDTIKYNGMSQLQMWQGEIKINSPNVVNPRQYQIAAYRKIIELMPNGISSKIDSMANLEGYR